MGYLDYNGLSYFWGKIKSYIAGLGYYTKPSGGIPASDIASGVIPTVPTTLSSFTDDLGSSPTHTHSQYLTSAPVTSVNGQTGAVSLTLGDANVIETVKVNGSALTPDANKAVDITVPSVSGKEDTTNKVTSLSSSSTDTQYPSAKATYTYINTMLGDIETLLSNI